MHTVFITHQSSLLHLKIRYSEALFVTQKYFRRYCKGNASQTTSRAATLSKTQNGGLLFSFFLRFLSIQFTVGRPLAFLRRVYSWGRAGRDVLRTRIDGPRNLRALELGGPEVTVVELPLRCMV